MCLLIALWLLPALACGAPKSNTTPAPTAAPTPVRGQKVFPTPSTKGQDVLLELHPADALVQWQHWLQPGSTTPGTNEVRSVNDPTYGQVIELRRACDGRDGGAAGLFQAQALDVASYQVLHVWLVGKVLLEQGGNIANRDPRWFPEGALQVRIKYLAAGGEEQEWFHGFYSQPVDGADHETFSQVNPGEWFTYTSPNLMDLPVPPQQITDFRVYGFGWQFQGQVADVRLVASVTGEE